MTATHLAVAPMLVALLTAVSTLLVGRWPTAQVTVSVGGALAYAAAVGALAWRAVLAPDAPGAVVYHLGDWPAPFGITLVADGLSTFMLAMAATVGPAALVFSVRYVVPRDQRVYFHPLFHFLVLGVTGAFLTGDLFNLFVWFEVMLLSSYVFVAFYGDGLHTRAALRYVVLNVVASAVMLLAIGGLYATTGTLNMADMARRLADPAAFGVRVGPVVGLSALLFAVVALKAGLVPFQFWVPAAYRAAPLPVTAMLAGVIKKVGIYVLLRLYFTVFGAVRIPVGVPVVGIEGGSPLSFYGPVLFAVATASILVGGLGAVGADSIEGVLAYSSIGQVGFIAVPVAVGAGAPTPAARHAAVLAALVYALNHALAKGMLFLAAGAVRSATGTSRFARLGGLADRSSVLAGAFLVGVLALVGVPPLSGFFAKLLVFDTALRGPAVPALGVLLGGTVLTIAYTTRAWISSFWQTPTPAVEEATVDPVQVAVVAILALTVVAVGVGFDPVYRFADAAATAAVDRGAYVDAVDPVGGGAA